MTGTKLINGNIVNEFDEIVGKYNWIYANKYYVYLYGSRDEMTEKQLIDKLDNLGLYAEPIWG